MVLFIMLYKVALTFQSLDEILKCDHSNESFGAALSCILVGVTIQMKAKVPSCDVVCFSIF